MPGIFMPRAFIIAMASGGICGMLAICMVEEMVHRPGLPCAAQAAAGARTIAVTITLETNFEYILVPMIIFRRKI
jgi:hypothetical protein